MELTRINLGSEPLDILATEFAGLYSGELGRRSIAR